MATVFANAVEIAHRQARLLAGELVTLQRGEGQTCQFTAVRGRTTNDDYGDGDATVVSQLLDWVHVSPAELLFGDVAFRPESGDLITDGDGTVYLVVNGPGEDVWRYMDQCRQAIRIHSVER